MSMMRKISDIEGFNDDISMEIDELQEYLCRAKTSIRDLRKDLGEELQSDNAQLFEDLLNYTSEILDNVEEVEFCVDNIVDKGENIESIVEGLEQECEEVIDMIE